MKANPRYVDFNDFACLKSKSVEYEGLADTDREKQVISMYKEKARKIETHREAIVHPT